MVIYTSMDREILLLALCMMVCTEMLDFCVIGDSTLYMFVVPVWLNFCNQRKNVSCGFSIVEQGIFFQYNRLGHHYNRTTMIGRSNDHLCTFMVAECHGIDWLDKIQQFWKTRGGISCKRLLTNYHHHARDYLVGKHTFTTISQFAHNTQKIFNLSIPFTEFVYILPTFPVSTSKEFPQTRSNVLETSAAMASIVETISTLHDLSEILRARGMYRDFLHVGPSNVTRDAFAMDVVSSMLTREFDICRRRQNSRPIDAN